MASELLAGRYRLQRLLMAGQNSQVWEAIDEPAARRVAVKRLLPGGASDRRQLQGLRHEARVGLRLRHPNIIRALHYENDRQSPFLVMELFAAPNLKLRIMHQEPIVRERMRQIVVRVAQGLAHMHEQGWVHRDVKPDNVLVNRAAEVRIIDFALARRIRSRWTRLITGRQKVQGTRSYMSPEQIRGEPLGAPADIYSLGATLFEMLTGRPPFRGETPNDLLVRHLRAQVAPPSVYNPDVTPGLDDLIVRMLAKKPEDRPGDMHEFLADFRSVRIFKDEAVAQEEPLH